MAKGYKYKQAKKEYQYKLRHYCADDPTKFKGKAKIAHRLGITPQRLNNWINRDNWNDMTEYTEAQTEMKFHENGKVVGKQGNCKLTKELYEKLFFYLSMIDDETGKRKYTNTQVSEKLNISVTTFYRYLDEDVPFYKIYQRAKLKIKGEIGLEKLIDGYEQKTIKLEKGDTPKGYIDKQVMEKKQIGPDYRAVNFALTNSAPEDYTNSPKANVKVEVNNIDISDLSDEELEKIVNGE